MALRHWSEGCHESVLSTVSVRSTPAGANRPPISVDGGAANSQFPIITGIDVSRLTYLRGDSKLENGELILEVNNKRVAGLTKSDVERWVRYCWLKAGSVTIRSVKPGRLPPPFAQFAIVSDLFC